MNQTKRISSDPSSVKFRLGRLGLQVEPLTKAAQEYYLAWAGSTPHLPTIYGGFVGWAHAIRSLRDDLKPAGWAPEEICGVNYVISPDGMMAITTATGNEFTGLLVNETGQDVEPRTKNDKGPRIQEAVKTNSRLLNRYLFADLEEAAIRELRLAERRRERVTWILLVSLDRRTREIRAELSLPTGMSDDECVSAWQERIVLPSTRFDDVTSGTRTDPGPNPQSPEITIDIKRRIG